MPTVKKAHREKIDKALDLCAESMLLLNKYIGRVLSPDKSAEFVRFLNSESYFAGGMFRSLFTDTKVNDMDIFFKSQHAALEMSRYMVEHNSKLGAVRTGYDNFVLTGVTSAPINFVLNNYGEPSTMLNNFDFTFNKHYFDPSQFDFLFDVDTFDWKGAYMGVNTKPAAGLLRYNRFVNEGFKIRESSLTTLAHQLINYERKATVPFSDVENMINEGRSSGEQRDTILLSGEVYSKGNYLEANEKAAKKSLASGAGATYLGAGPSAQAVRFYGTTSATTTR